MIENNDNLCFICYDSMENNNFIQFEKCNHRVCSACSIEVMFQRIPTCPFDKEKIEVIHDFTTEQKAFNSIDEYKKWIWTSHKESLQEEFENYSIIYLTKAIRSFNIIMLTQRGMQNILQKASQNTSNFTKKELKHFRNLFNEFKNRLKAEGEIEEDLHVMDIVSECFIYNPSDKIKTVEILWKSDCSDKTIPINLNIANNFLKTLEQDILSFIVTIEFDDLIKHEDQKQLVNKLKNINELDIKYGNHIKKRIASFVLSNIRKNQDTFKLIHPNIDEYDTSLCLVCSEKIIPVSFAKFKNCDHKICLSCIKECVIMHGSCPYHSDIFQDLEIIQNIDVISNENELSSIYLRNNFDLIFTDILNNNIDNIILPINEIVNIKNVIKDLIDTLTGFFKENENTEKINNDNNNENNENLNNKNETCENVFELVKTLLTRSNLKGIQFNYARLDEDGIFSKTILHPLIQKYKGTSDGNSMITKMKMKTKLENEYFLKFSTFYREFTFLTEIYSNESIENWEGLEYIENFLESYIEFCKIFNLDSMEKEFPHISRLYTALGPLKCTFPLELENVAYCLKEINGIWPDEVDNEDVDDNYGDENDDVNDDDDYDNEDGDNDDGDENDVAMDFDDEDDYDGNYSDFDVFSDYEDYEMDEESDSNSQCN